MYYLNRTGQPEGPFSEQQLVDMVRSGQLRDGWVALQGQSQWAPLSSVPAVAAALQEPSATGYTAPGSAAGYTAPGYDAPGAGAAGHTEPGGAPHYGTPPGTAPAGGYAAAPGGSVRKQAGSKLPLLLGLGALALLLFVGIGAFAAYAFFFKANGPRIAALLPGDTEVYLEAPNVRALALAAGRARYMKSDVTQDDAWLKDQAAVMARSFGVDESTAVALALAQRSVGVAMKGVDAAPSGGLLLEFDATGPVETLLGSQRFKAEGELPGGGKRYSLSKKTASAPSGEGWTRALEQMFDEAHTQTDMAIGWWGSSEVLAIGSLALLQDIGRVREGQQAPLSKLERFNQAMKQTPKDAVLLGWLDGVTVKRLSSKQRDVDVSLTDEGAVLSVSGNEAGVLTQLAGTLVGSDVTQTPLFIEPSALTYPATLPIETVGYLALSTKTSLDGAGLERQLFDAVKRKDARAESDLREVAEQFKATTGVSLADALGAIGDELVVGALAPASMKFRGVDPKQLTQGGAYAALRLKNQAVAEKLVAQLRDKILVKEVGDDMTPKGTGMLVKTPLGPDVVVEVRFLDKQLVIAGGSRAMVDKAFAALSGQGERLQSDAAHTAVLETLPETASQIVWVDTGRVTERLLDGNPQVQSAAKQMGISLDQIELSGPNRVTSALAVTLKAEQKAWRVQLDSTNFAHGLGLVGGVGAAAFASGAGVALSGGRPNLVPTGAGPVALGGSAGGATCARAVSCCKELMSKSGQASAANCDALGMAPASACAQALEGYQRAARAVGARCD